MPLGVIFDMDGVILDNNFAHKKAWEKYSRDLGFSLSEEDFKTKVFGKTNEEILVNFFPDATPEVIEQLSLEKEAVYRSIYFPDFKILAGLESLLKNLQLNNIPVAVASNAPLVNIDFALDTGFIRPYFKSVVSAKMVEKPKPAPDIYLKAAESINRKPDNCIVFEDSLTGVQAANAAGCQVVGVTTTYSKEELEPHCALVINDFTSVTLSYLKEVFERIAQ